MAGNLEQLIIIGLTGYKQHGKSTVAQRLVDEHGFTRLSFAGPLKAMADRINPVVGINSYEEDGYVVSKPIHLAQARLTHTDENDLKEAYPLYRLFLQRLGTEGLRAIDDGFWVGLLDAQVAGHAINKGVTRFVIDDARFPNEAEYFKGMAEQGVVAPVWQITRPGAETPKDSHTSEQHVGNLNEERHLKNAGSVDDLNALVDAIVAPYIEEAESK